MEKSVGTTKEFKIGKLIDEYLAIVKRIKGEDPGVPLVSVKINPQTNREREEECDVRASQEEALSIRE